MEKDQLKDLENDSKELLYLLKETRDIENSALELPALDEITGKRKHTYTMRRISTWWVAAALAAGIIIGNLAPRASELKNGSDYASTYYADTCRSLADGDINFSLLITHL